jgi:hypothetical protein
MATLKGLEGLEVTPLGRELSDTWTEPEKPLSGFTETLMAELVAPCAMEMELEERLIEKSGAGGGGGEIEEEEPPQPAFMEAKERKSASGTP